MADGGELEAAGHELSAALARCPRHPGVLRALAAIRFQRAEHAGAAELAGALVRLEPASAWGWELLGTTRYLLDDVHGALEAWNRIGRPHLETAEILLPGEHTWSQRDRGAVGAAPFGGALAPLAPLAPPTRVPGPRLVVTPALVTPALLARVRARLEAVPGVARARVDFRPLAGGGARVEGAVQASPPHTLARRHLPGHLARAAGGRLELAVGPPGRRVVVRGEFAPGVRASGGQAAFSLPGGLGAAGTLSLTHRRLARWETKTERTGFRVGLRPWPSARWRGEVALGADRRPGRGDAAAAEGHLVVTLPRRAELLLEGAWGSTPFGTFQALVRGGTWGIDGLHPGLGGSGQVGAVGVGGKVPLDRLPRFGRGAGATALLRAADDFLPAGRSWLHGSVELGHAWLPLPGVVTGVAVFADGVHGVGGGTPGPTLPEDRTDARRRGAVHLGGGLRLGVAGVDGHLRLDGALDPATGRTGVSVAWVERFSGASAWWR
jgi:hypothetical protein